MRSPMSILQYWNTSLFIEMLSLSSDANLSEVNLNLYGLAQILSHETSQWQSLHCVLWLFNIIWPSQLSHYFAAVIHHANPCSYERPRRPSPLDSASSHGTVYPTDHSIELGSAIIIQISIVSSTIVENKKYREANLKEEKTKKVKGY